MSDVEHRQQRFSLNRCARCFIPTLGNVKEGALGLVAGGVSGLDSRPYDFISLDCSTKHSSFRKGGFVEPKISDEIFTHQ